MNDYNDDLSNDPNFIPREDLFFIKAVNTENKVVKLLPFTYDEQDNIQVLTNRKTYEIPKEKDDDKDDTYNDSLMFSLARMNTRRNNLYRKIVKDVLGDEYDINVNKHDFVVECYDNYLHNYETDIKYFMKPMFYRIHQPENTLAYIDKNEILTLFFLLGKFERNRYQQEVERYLKKEQNQENEKKQSFGMHM